MYIIYIYQTFFNILYVVTDIDYVFFFCLNRLLLKNCVGQSNIPILMVATIVAFGP